MSQEPVDVHRPRTYLVWGFFATMLCFLPLGLVCLYYGIKTSRTLEAGDVDEAAHLSRRTKVWLIWTIAVGVVIYLVIGAALLLLGAFSS